MSDIDGKKTSLFLGFAALAAAASFVGIAARADAPPATSSAAAAAQKAVICAACHGPAGISANDLWPNLAGQKSGYLAAQLKAFHDGKRVNELMNGIAKTLTDQDMRDLAEHFSKLSPCSSQDHGAEAPAASAKKESSTP